MTTTTSAARRHRPDRGNPAPRLDPYAIGNSTFTLEAWRRAQEHARRATAPGRRSRSRTAPR